MSELVKITVQGNNTVMGRTTLTTSFHNFQEEQEQTDGEQQKEDNRWKYFMLIQDVNLRVSIIPFHLRENVISFTYTRWHES